MAFKCVNELDKFMFQDAEVKKMELNPGLMTMVLLGVAAKHNNPSNDTLTDRYLDDTELRFKSPVITRFLLAQSIMTQTMCCSGKCRIRIFRKNSLKRFSGKYRKMEKYL